MLKQAFFTAVIYILAAAQAADAQDAIACGKYLVELGDCAGCHANGSDSRYVGGQPLSAGFGTIYSSNITPDKQTGIGTWSQEQFYRAMHEGIRADGAYLYPAFPYNYFTNISRADSDAIYAYLQSLKPVHAVRPPNRLIFPFNLRPMMWFWNAMFLNRQRFQPNPSKSAQWNRGAYIANGLGHCGGCHTPKNLLFGDEMKKAFTGEDLGHWFSANLTADRVDGLGQWSALDIVQFLKTGRNDYAAAAGSMQEVVTRSTSRMTDSDLAALATYLTSLPAAPEQAPAAPEAGSMRAGEIIFVQSCSACHSAPDHRQSSDYPQLAGDPLVNGHDPTTLVRILLQGAQSAVTANAATGYSMPSFVALGDEDIAAVVTYIRNAWGNRASPVTRDQVTNLRTILDTGSD